MLQELSLELLENVVAYLPYNDFYNLAKVDGRVSELLKKSYCWIVKLPKPVDWTSSNAPRKYTPYDKTDFEIYYRGETFRRGQGVSFTSGKIEGKKCLVSNHSTPIILYKDYLVIEPSTTKIVNCLQLGYAKPEISYNDIAYIVYNWIDPKKRGTRGCDSGCKGERGYAGIRTPRSRVSRQLENTWRSTENIRVKGKLYETDFSLEFETDPKYRDYLENDE